MRDFQTKAEGVCGCQKGREMGWLCFGLLAHFLHISVFRFLCPWILSYVVVSWCVCVCVLCVGWVALALGLDEEFRRDLTLSARLPLYK
jgi:hypothetical protein